MTVLSQAELESQAATQGATGNGSNIHTCTCGIGYHVLGCSDIGRLIVAFCSQDARFFGLREELMIENAMMQPIRSTFGSIARAIFGSLLKYPGAKSKCNAG